MTLLDLNKVMKVPQRDNSQYTIYKLHADEWFTIVSIHNGIINKPAIYSYKQLGDTGNFSRLRATKEKVNAIKTYFRFNLTAINSGELEARV